jgi:hypothetical protein
MRTPGPPTAPRRRLAAANFGGIFLHWEHSSNRNISATVAAVKQSLDTKGGALSQREGTP